LNKFVKTAAFSIIFSVSAEIPGVGSKNGLLPPLLEEKMHQNCASVLFCSPGTCTCNLFMERPPVEKYLKTSYILVF
jgi:hypothetical protein